MSAIGDRVLAAAAERLTRFQHFHGWQPFCHLLSSAEDRELRQQAEAIILLIARHLLNGDVVDAERHGMALEGALRLLALDAIAEQARAIDLAAPPLRAAQ